MAFPLQWLSICLSSWIQAIWWHHYQTSRVQWANLSLFPTKLQLPASNRQPKFQCYRLTSNKLSWIRDLTSSLATIFKIHKASSWIRSLLSSKLHPSCSNCLTQAISSSIIRALQEVVPYLISSNKLIKNHSRFLQWPARLSSKRPLPSRIPVHELTLNAKTTTVASA